MSRLSLSSIFFALLSFAALAGAQVAPGAPSFVPQDCHEVDCVDLLNNVVSLNLPVRSKSGAFPFRYGLNGSYFESVTATNTWQPSVISSTPFLVPLSQTASFPGVDGWGGNSTVSANCPSGPLTRERPPLSSLISTSSLLGLITFFHPKISMILSGA